MIQQHECRTTFAGGANPFVAARQFMHGYEPPTRRAGKPCITKSDILALMADGKGWSIQEVTKALNGNSNSIGETLAAMARSGLVGKRQRVRLPKKSVPEYFIWG